MTTVQLRSVTRVFPGATRPALDAVTLRVERGECLALYGPAGSGKSTLTRIVAGHDEPTSGSVWIGGADVTSRSTNDRDVAVVLRDYALYPHMTVEENMAFPLRLAGMSEGERHERVREAADTLALSEYLGQCPQDLPHEARHRVSLARAIVRRPSVFLLDEPLASIAVAQRQGVGQQIRDLQRRLGVTTIYATSEPEEALYVGDRVAVLTEGRITACDTPDAIGPLTSSFGTECADTGAVGA